ncbi:MAG: hypothetical protein AAF611_09670 [Bacteroidota bacterium]
MYQTKNKQLKDQSSIYRNEIKNKLEYVDYNEVGDALVAFITLGIIQTTVEEMRSKGRELRDIGKYFSSVKHNMTKEDKAEIFGCLVRVREHHDSFWAQYKKISQQQYEKRKNDNQRAWKEKQLAWEEKKEKSRRIKQKIEQNLEKNRSGLRKAEDALERHKERRRKLKDDIRNAYNDNWRSKAEGWLYELDNKISDIEASIDRYHSWIDEDSSKLDNWN